MTKLTAAQRAFVQDIDQRFPDRSICQRFNAYAALAPKLRLAVALRDAQNILRTGWVRVGVPIKDVQSVDHHQKSIVKLINLLMPSSDISKDAAAMARIHDLTEAIASDFTPDDQISKEEKSNLEGIAARVIFEAYPKRLQSWREYEDGKTSTAIFVHDMDKCEMMCHALCIEEKYPSTRGKLDIFWQRTEQSLQTELAKNLFAELKELREKLYAPMESFWESATEHAIYRCMRESYIRR